MSCSEDYKRTRELRGRGHRVITEKKSPKKITWCVVCGVEIPLEDGKICCEKCWEEMNGGKAEVKDPMELFHRSRSLERVKI